MVKIQGCNLSNNSAYHGSGLYLQQINSNEGKGLNVVIGNVTIGNVTMYLNILIDNHVTSVGAIYSYHSTLMLSGDVTFIANQGTALHMISSSQAFVSNNSSMIFENNTLSFGQLAVIKCSVLTLGESTILEFTHNGNVSVVLFSFCDSDVGENGSERFLQYTNKSIHPDHWDAQSFFQRTMVVLHIKMI